MTSLSIPDSYSCIWLSENMIGALDHYKNIFPDLNVETSSAIASTFTALGTKMMLLQGGPKFRANQAISYFLYAEGKDKAVNYFEKLKEGGRVIFPLKAYPWAECYGWVEDRFGVNWQIDGDVMRSSQKIVPTLLFVNEKRFLVREAIERYTAIFPDSVKLMEAPHQHHPNVPEDAILFAQVRLGKSLFNMMSSIEDSHDFDFTPGNSFVLPCVNQEEIDYYWEKLGDGGSYDMCGWLRDRYGVSWQIIPEILPRLMNDPIKGSKVIEAFLKMQKFDLNVLLSV